MGMLHSLYLIGVIVLISMAVLLFRMQETHPRLRKTVAIEEGEGAVPSA